MEVDYKYCLLLNELDLSSQYVTFPQIMPYCDTNLMNVERTSKWEISGPDSINIASDQTFPFHGPFRFVLSLNESDKLIAMDLSSTYVTMKLMRHYSAYDIWAPRVIEYNSRASQ